jgi:hypothetical protein
MQIVHPGQILACEISAKQEIATAQQAIQL